ncbi:MAG TPA: sigma-70 family RNA polymerase sigma factor [Pyrinomonadaceae bacterium]|nr:sigma-70 family RNA polymerase sigma factor [Pyrinomonadaceae bacterium]
MHPLEEPTDDALVAAAGAGNEAAFEQLFERHRRQAARIAGRFFPQREQIEEIIQDSFTKVYLALGSYHGTHAASFKAWLTQIVVNSCYDQLRRVRRRPEQSLGELEASEGHELAAQVRSAGSDVESALVSRDLAGKLLARVSPEDRLVLTLLDVEGFSVAEIAEMMNWSISKVKVRAHRARAHLRGVLRRFL